MALESQTSLADFLEAPLEHHEQNVEQDVEDVDLTVEQDVEEVEPTEKRSTKIVKPQCAYIEDKVTHVEDRLMRNNIKLHETVRQINHLVEVFDNTRTDPNWFFSKLSHELQDFVEAFWS